MTRRGRPVHGDRHVAAAAPSPADEDDPSPGSRRPGRRRAPRTRDGRAAIRHLLAWTLLALLLGQTGCAGLGAGSPSPAAAPGGPAAPTGIAPTLDRQAARAEGGWASRAGACLKDFASGRLLDPTVLVMLPLVVPVCAAIGALDIPAPQPAPVRAASEADPPGTRSSQVGVP